MQDMQKALEEALLRTIKNNWFEQTEVLIQEVPPDKPGDFGSPVAFSLARVLEKNPTLIAQEIVASLELPEGIERAEAIGPYINVFVNPGVYVHSIVTTPSVLPETKGKVIVEHTSVNPNKEAHVGHLRNIVLGDSTARILAAVGYDVEVQNYIDDTGRQAAESLFAIDYFGASFDDTEKYDHWLGELYVRLGRAKLVDGAVINRGVQTVMDSLESGGLRAQVEAVVRAQLETCHALGVEYDLLVWESDVVRSGFLDRGLEIVSASKYVSQPTDGKYAGALVMDVSEFIPGLEEPNVVLVRSDGNAMYVAKDIGYQFWKAGLFEGLRYQHFCTQPSGRPLYSSAPKGEASPDGRQFAHGEQIINVIGAEQSHPQILVRTALELSGTDEAAAASQGSRHLAYELVTLEGQAMSGRKGISLAADHVLSEAHDRARALMKEKNPDLKSIDEVAWQVGIGALRFSLLKSEARRAIDFRWDQALSLQGDSAPYVQYAHARACSILRTGSDVGLDTSLADWGQVGSLEVKLAQIIARLPRVVEVAARDLAPHLVAQYALDLATSWNSYYNHKAADGKSDTQVIRAAPGLREARLGLVERICTTLKASLLLLGIEAPERM
jgi:arginyl-tRNA synthetase